MLIIWRLCLQTIKCNQNLSNWDVSNVNNCISFSDNTTSWTLPKLFYACNPD